MTRWISTRKSHDSGTIYIGDLVVSFTRFRCFPIVPKLACSHLGLSILDPPKPLTLLGGLTSFGGAGNNYSMHAITEMCRYIRSRRIENGLVLANGGVLSYQHALCLSSRPRAVSPYPDSRSTSMTITGKAPPIEVWSEGEARVETYTVEFGRDGRPERAFVIGRLQTNNHRFVANNGDQRTLQRLASAFEEQVGKEGYVQTRLDTKGTPVRNVFFLGPRPGL